MASLVAQGLTNRRIAAALVLTTRTVDTHISHILHKLGLASRGEPARWAIEQHGLLVRAATE